MQTHTPGSFCCCFVSVRWTGRNIVHFRLPRKIVGTNNIKKIHEGHYNNKRYAVCARKRERKIQEKEKKNSEKETQESSSNSFILHAHCAVINGIVSVIFQLHQFIQQPISNL